MCSTRRRTLRLALPVALAALLLAPATLRAQGQNKVVYDKFDWKMMDGKKLFGLRRGSTPQMFWEHLLKKNGVSQATIMAAVRLRTPRARIASARPDTRDRPSSS